MPATWYQLKMSATNDAGRTSATYNFATTNMAGERIATPAVFPNENSMNEGGSFKFTDQSDWILVAIVALIILAASMLVYVNFVLYFNMNIMMNNIFF